MSKTTTLTHQHQLASTKKKRNSSVGDLANYQQPGEKYRGRGGTVTRDKAPEERRRIQNQDGYRLGGSSQSKSSKSPLSTMKRRSSSRRKNDQDKVKQNAKGNDDEDRDHSRSNYRRPDAALRPLADQKVGKGNTNKKPTGEKDVRAKKVKNTTDTEGGFIAVPGNNSESIDLPGEAPKQPLLDYYKSRGVDYKLLRSDCQIPIDGPRRRGRGGAGLALDCYTIPLGYTIDDLPSSQSFESHREEPSVSPAVLLAKNNGSKLRSRVKSDPSFNPNSVIANIEKTLGLRQNDKENKPEPMTSSSTQRTADNMDDNDPFETPFPDGSLNDSDLLLITVSQQAENKFKESKGQDSEKVNTFPDRGPNTSTPVCDGVRKRCENETPKARSYGLTRMRNRKSNNSSEMEKSDDNFDKSTLLFEESITEETKEDSPTPRKLLKFDGSPINTVEQNPAVTCHMQDVVGCFEEDENDHFFSQLEYATPAESKRNTEKKEGSDRSDENYGTPMQEGGEADFDSYIDMADMEALDMLEAEHGGKNIANIVA